MYSGNTISLKQILWKVLRNPLAAELNIDEAADFAVEAIRLLGAPLVLVDEVSNPPLKVENYKTSIPDNLLNIRGVRLITNLENYEQGSIPLRHATDIYHTALKCEPTSPNNEIEYSINTPDPSGATQKNYADITANSARNQLEFTYTTQKGIMYTSFDEGYVQLSYKALGVDEDGYVLIPDDKRTVMAVEYYILHRYLEPLWMLGKITDKAFNYVEQKRHFYMAGASVSLQLQGIDHLESVMNTVNRIIINTQAFNNHYNNSGAREKLKRYN